jgi:ELWxxDGT repeat protein
MTVANQLRIRLSARRAARALQLESLEARSLLAAQPQLLLDIDPGAASSSPSPPVAVGERFFFTAIDSVHGRELWVSDGTAAGTNLFVDLLPGAVGSTPSGLTNVNGVLYFTLGENARRGELWKSDGTPGGTVLVKDIDAAAGGELLSGLTKVDGMLYFTTAVAGGGLWKSDGTPEGTVRVKEGLGEGVEVRRLISVNGTLYFSTSSDGAGYELWKTDGTPEGTVLVKDIQPGSGGSNPFSLTNVDGTLYFLADDGVHGEELWKSDGTPDGTVLVKDIRAGSANSLARLLTKFNGILYFCADDELWKSDGTTQGTVLVKDIASFGGTVPLFLTPIGGTLYFQANDGITGRELWKSDGTAAGTVLVKDIQFDGSNPRYLTNVNGTLYFRADDGVTGTELWKSDGTAAGTVLVRDIRSGASGSDALFLTNVNGALYFSTDDGVHGREPWILPATSVVGRHVFYNNSFFDGNNAGANSADDAAIDTSKSALLPGGTAGFANYTGYSRGLNGLMIDLANRAGGTLTAADFAFKVGNNNNPASWATLATAPSVSVRAGAGLGGSDRVTLIWPDGAIAKTWLQATVLATANTGLSSPDVFYFGNAVGEVGNSTSNAIVTSADESLIRINFTTGFGTVPVTSPYDIDKNRFVQASDAALSRANQTTAFTALRLIVLPPEAALGSGGAALRPIEPALDVVLAGTSSFQDSNLQSLGRRRRG